MKTLQPYNFGELPPEMQDKAEKMMADISPLGEVNEGTVDAKEAWGREDVLVLMRAMYNEALRQPRSVPSDDLDDKAAMDYYLNLTNSSYGEGGNLLPRSINEAFKAGIAWERERLLARAIKANIFDVEDGSDAAKLIVRIPGAKVGDEVEIIIKKEK